MKTGISFIFSLFLLSSLFGQSLERQIISPLGFSSDTDARVSVTVGEPVIFSFEGSKYIVNAGFQIGGTDLTTPTVEIETASYELEFFPVPTRDYVNLRIGDPNHDIQQISVYDMSGRHLGTQHVGYDQSIRIDMRNYRSGRYGIMIHTEKGSAFGSWVMKID